MWKVSVKFLFWQVFGILWLKICSRMFATHIFSKGHELHCLRTIYLKRNQYLYKRDVFTTDANCIRSRINSLMTTNESIFYASKHFICNFSVWRWEKKKNIIKEVTRLIEVVAVSSCYLHLRTIDRAQFSATHDWVKFGRIQKQTRTFKLNHK